MGIFDRFRKKTGTKTPSDMKEEVKPSKELEAVKQVAAQAEDASLVKAKGGNELTFRLLRRPHVSEKAARLTEHGTYVFDVPISAEKISIKKAVEGLYNVKVMAVRTIRHAGKPVFRGRRASARSSWKKALVTLKKGDRIDLYEGV